MAYIFRFMVKYRTKYISRFYNYQQYFSLESLTYCSYAAIWNGEETLNSFWNKIHDDLKFARVNPNILKVIVDELHSSDCITSKQFLTLLPCFGDSMIKELPKKRTELVLELWNKLKNLSYNFSIDHYNTLLLVHLQNEFSFSPIDVFRELNELTLEPNIITYERLISRYCLVGDINGAMNILHTIRDRSMPISREVLNDLIRCYSCLNDMENAKNILDIMRKVHIVPDSDTYSNLICGYIKQGQLDKIDELMLICRLKRIYIFNKSTFNIIYHLALYDYEDKIEKVLLNMKRVINFRTEALKCINKLINIGKYDSAYKISISVPPDVFADGKIVPSGNFFLHYIIRCNIPIEQVIRYCEELINKNFNKNALSIAINCCMLYNNREKAILLIDAGKQRQLPFSTTVNDLEIN